MLNQAISFRAGRAGDIALSEIGSTDTLEGPALRAIGGAVAMVFAIWMTLLGIVVLTIAH